MRYISALTPTPCPQSPVSNHMPTATPQPPVGNRMPTATPQPRRAHVHTHLVRHPVCRAERSELVRELEEEITGAPKEMRIPGGASESAFALREQERMDERERAEEDMMMRVPLTKNERRRARAARALGGSGAALVDDIGGEVAGLLDADELTTGLEDDGTGLLRKRLAQVRGC